MNEYLSIQITNQKAIEIIRKVSKSLQFSNADVVALAVRDPRLFIKMSEENPWSD